MPLPQSPNPVKSERKLLRDTAGAVVAFETAFLLEPLAAAGTTSA